MAEQPEIQWLDGQAKDTKSVEKICPRRHIRQNQWQSKWNGMYLSNCYDYISDYECIFNHPIDENNQWRSYPKRWYDLKKAKRQGTNVSIRSLAHFTTEEKANLIVNSKGFTGGRKKFDKYEDGNNVEQKFSWWSPKFDKDAITLVRNTLEEAIQPFLADRDGEEEGELTRLKNQFATSDAFSPNSQRGYGSQYFQYGIDDLCRYYGELFDDDDDEVQFKILGTFGYKVEVMHAVLVCSQTNGVGMFSAYPSVLTPEEDVYNEAVVTRDKNGNWVWKPQSTGTVIKRLPDRNVFPKYRRWEHVAFAFHIPDEWEKDKQFMFVPDLKDNLHQIQ